MRKIILLLFFVAFSANAQNVDDLDCRSINEKAMSVYQTNPNLAAQLLKKAEVKANQSNDDELIALTQNNLAILKRMKGAFLESKKISNSVLNQAKETLTKASIYNNIGACDRSLGLYDESIKYYLKALKIYENLKDIKRQATVDNNIGMVFSSLEQYDKAKIYQRKALQLFIQMNDQKGLSETYNNFAISLANQECILENRSK
jgi:tetratricopeptide (TPR) repeat protein